MKAGEIEAYKKAGEIAKKVVAYSKEFIKPGMKLIDIADKIDDKIDELGGEPAFPVNLSLNEIAAHYTPSRDDETIAEGLLKVDIGVSVNGYIADTAFSLDLSEDKKFEEMIKNNQEVLENVLKKIKPSWKVKQVGKAVQEKLDKKYVVIRNLSGHSLGKNQIHSGLTISNYENDNETVLEDITIAIEPFLTTGSGKIYDGKKSEIYVLKNEKNVRDKDARELLKFIKQNYQTKPFCTRWLEKQRFKKIRFLLKLLVEQGILYNYSVLVEKSKKPVSQAEHTVIITNEICITTR